MRLVRLPLIWALALATGLAALNGCSSSSSLPTPAPPAPAASTITSFAAAPESITSGQSATLTAVFAGGAGVITPGNLSVTSGTGVQVTPTSTQVYTLTVTPATGQPITGTVTITVKTATATNINSKLGMPNRVLFGLGAGNNISDMTAQGIQPDIIDTYLVGFGSTSWISWNSPSGAYLTITANSVKAIGAVPMFTLYQMAQNGDGDITWISQSSQMDTYWSQVRLMFQLIGSYGKPTLVNLEPDFWGYVDLDAPSGDPTQMAASVNDQAECSSLPNTAAGIAQCQLAMARKYAPNALVGYPPSFWGESAPTVAAFMTKIGAQDADFIVAQTSDRDAGCMEVVAPPPECAGRGSGPFYWDENNVTTPNFVQSLTLLSTYRSDLTSNLPIIWWQTPLGVPSSTPGGTTNHYRDDHVDYMLKHPAQYADIGTVGMVFSGGAASQTGITTDGGQFATVSKQYLSTGGTPTIY